MNYGFPAHNLSPQAYRRLGAALSAVEASDLADDIAAELERSGVAPLSSAKLALIYRVLRRGA